MNRDERIARWLVDREILRPADLSEALNRSNVTGEPLWGILKEMGRLNDDQISYLLTRLEEDQQVFEASERPTEALGENAAPIWRAFEGLGDFGQSRQILAQSTHVLDPKNPDDADDEVGELTLDQNLPPRLKVYRDFRMVGRGGMGSVYVANHRESGHSVAIKFLFKAKLTDRDIERFRREFLAISRMDHPNIIKVLDFSFETQENEKPIPPYLVMEWIDGESLSDFVLTECGMDLDKRRDKLIPLFGKIAEALAHAHEQGIIHRDLKPTNILIEAETQRPVIVDFGLVKFDSSKVTDLESLTASGVMIGTPSYMPPEQLFGYKDKISERVDVWSYAATFFYCLTGELPFAADNVVQQVLLIKSKEARRLSTVIKEIPEWLDEVISQCFAREPDQRPRMKDILLFVKEPNESSAAANMLRSSGDAITLPNLLRVLTKPSPKSGAVFRNPLFLSSLTLLILSITVFIYVLLDHQPPSLKLYSNPDYVKKPEFHLRGSVKDENPAFLRIKEAGKDWRKRPLSDKDFDVLIQLELGANVIIVQAEDQRGNQSPPQHINVVYDIVSPNFLTLKCQARSAGLLISGTVSERDCTLHLLGQTVQLEGLSFSFTIDSGNIRDDLESFEIRCIDAAGNEVNQSVRVPR